MELARLSVVIDPTGAEEGARRIAQAARTTIATLMEIDGVQGQNDAKVTARGTERAREVSALTERFIADQLRAAGALQTELRPALEDTALAMELTARALAQEAISAEDADAKLQQLREAYEATANAAQEQAAATNQAATATGGVARASTGAVRGLQGVTNTLARQAAALIGLRSGLGTVAGVLGSFALGPLTALGVIAGLAAVALAFRAITKESREAKKEQAELLEALRRTAQQEARTPEKSIEAALANRQRVADRILALSQAAPTPGGARAGDFAAPIAQAERLTALTKELADAENLVAIARRNAGKAGQETNDKQLAALTRVLSLGAATTADLAARDTALAAIRERLQSENLTLEQRATLLEQERSLVEATARATKDADQAALEAARQLAGFREAELQARLAIATAAGDTAEAEGVIREMTEARIAATLDGFASLSQASRDYLEALLRQAAAWEAQERAVQRLGPLLKAMMAEVRAAEQGGPLGLQRAISASGGRTAVTRPKDGDLFDVNDARAVLEQKATEDARRRERAIRDLERLQIASLEAAVEMGALSPAMGAVGVAMVQFRAQLRTLKENGENATVAIAGLVATLAAAVVQGNSAAAAGARGALGGAAAGVGLGLMSGNPIVAAAAGVVGAVVGGIFGASSRRRQLQRERQRDVNAYGQALGQFSANVGPQKTGLDRDLDALKKQFEALQAEARRLGLSTRALNQAYAAQVAYLKAVQAAEQARVQEDLAVRRLTLEGFRDEAEARALAARQQKDFEDLVADGYDQATIQAQAHVHWLEREALVREQAVRKIEEQAAAMARTSDLEAREQGLRGNDGAAARIRLEAQANRELAQAQADLVAGRIDEGTYARWVAVLTGELAEGFRDLAEAEQDAVEAAARLAEQRREDLEYRRLVAIGMDEEADAYRIRIQQQREYDEMVAAGSDAATLSLLDWIHTLEDQARATAQAAAEQQKLLDLQTAMSRTTEDLAVRMLRAKGSFEAAADAALLYSQQEEVRRAREAGFSEALIAEILEVQAAEREAADQVRRDRQQEAFDRAVSSAADQAIADSRTQTSSAVGLTDATGTRMAGLLSSGLVYWSQQTRLQQRMVGLLESINRSAGGTDLENVDRGLGTLTQETGRAQGQVPSNI